MMKKRKGITICRSVVAATALVIALAKMGPLATTVHAYATWSDGCIGCHGDFNSGTYVSQRDGSWGTNLMSGHSGFMGSGTCNVCHQPPAGTPRAPTFIGLSAGITGYSPVSCLGCHGRAEDKTGVCVAGDPNTIDPANCGMGAGLRRHHANAGITDCADCHSDSTPVGENVLPAYYFTPDTTHPNKPINPCNTAPTPGNENKFGQLGLDNDGDGLYDQNDTDCAGVTPETGADCFNGIDDDGDGATDCADTGCSGATGAATNCGDGACAASGNRVCQGGQLVDTCTPLQPGVEGPFGDPTCADNSDNDCDTLADAADQDCAQVCVPTQEGCDGLDNDCDGVIDNGIDPVAINCGTGICQANGQRVCIGGVLVDQCIPGAPQTEICNNLDDDCDGVIDDIAATPTTCGDGACANTGQLICQNGQQVDTCTPLPAGTEGSFGDATCADGIDNDCDGTTDAADTGCAQVCVPQTEVCDGLDNDCNGLIDDGIAPVDITCGEGACVANGQRVCVTGVLQDQCTALPPGTEGPFGDATCGDGIDNDCDGFSDAADSNCAATCVPTQEICDGKDNDCDGVIDNNIPATPTNCGIGACANAGHLECQSGQFVDTCRPLPAGAEGPFSDPTCADNIDNDCDALVDAADPGCAAPPVEEACFDQMDNDSDGLVDCADRDCAGARNGACDTGLAGVCAAGQVQCVNGAAACIQVVFPKPEICTDGTDNDCDGLTDGADPNCQGPRVDFDIEKLSAAERIDICPPPRDPRIGLAVVVENESHSAACFDVTVVGVENGVEIYRQVKNACLKADRKLKVAFPNPMVSTLKVGTIKWTATIADGDPDNDLRTAKTSVVCKPSGKEDEDDD